MELDQIILYISSGMFYLLTGILGFLGAFSIYIYIRYARSPITAVIVSVLFGVMFLIVSGNALTLLKTT
jgi:drug/metabolite transporter superfamily protein YnfA